MYVERECQRGKDILGGCLVTGGEPSGDLAVLSQYHKMKFKVGVKIGLGLSVTSG